jgi:hypothetical protein
VTNDDQVFRHRLLPFAKAGEVGVTRAWSQVRLPPLLVLPLEAGGGAPGIGDVATARVAAASNAEPVATVGRGTSNQLCARSPGSRTEAGGCPAAVADVGGLVVSASGVLKLLRGHGLGTRIHHLALVAGCAAKPEREALPPPEPLHLEAEQP